MESKTNKRRMRVVAGLGCGFVALLMSCGACTCFGLPLRASMSGRPPGEAIASAMMRQDETELRGLARRSGIAHIDMVGVRLPDPVVSLWLELDVAVPPGATGSVRVAAESASCADVNGWGASTYGTRVSRVVTPGAAGYEADHIHDYVAEDGRVRAWVRLAEAPALSFLDGVATIGCSVRWPSVWVGDLDVEPRVARLVLTQ
ncbi:MAG: hypothetical protein KF729_14650 [Sandaracinaceae bacterium]|nr:hypothetical protein [Sandaracinaceae bacterium]